MSASSATASRSLSTVTPCSWSSLSPNPRTVIAERFLRKLTWWIFFPLWPTGIPLGVVKSQLFSSGWLAWPVSWKQKVVIVNKKKITESSHQAKCYFYTLVSLLPAWLWVLQGIYKAITNEVKRRLMLLQVTNCEADGYVF